MSAKVLSFAEAVTLLGKLKGGIQQEIFGQEQLIEDSLCCLLAQGHILITGAPGLAKTTLVRVLANQLHLEFGRIQFTPDLMPSDIIGAEILSNERQFKFTPGPVFTNLLLADEINRASPRTQSALLEAMQERTCTVNGVRHQLPAPFMVFATQNPFESEGTFPLPEAQLDRFLLHTLVDYPTPEAEEKIYAAHVRSNLVGEKIPSLQTPAGAKKSTAERLSSAEVLALMQCVRNIPLADELLAAIAEIVRMSRPEDETCPQNLRPMLWYGAGPRAGLSLISTARGLALLEQSEIVRWRHVKRMLPAVLRHRIKVSLGALRDGIKVEHVINQLTQMIEQKYRNLA